MGTFLYFAYGSNMLTRRLQERTPSATKVSTGFVTGRRLAFHKVSKDGSGKCDIAATNAATDVVHGVLFDIFRSEKPDLDSAEGLGHGYKEKTITVRKVDGTQVSALVYIATAIDSAMRPYDWYKDFVAAGAEEHGLPRAYVGWIRTFRSQPDPDGNRRAENERLLLRG